MAEPVAKLSGDDIARLRSLRQARRCEQPREPRKTRWLSYRVRHPAATIHPVVESREQAVTPAEQPHLALVAFRVAFLSEPDQSAGSFRTANSKQFESAGPKVVEVRLPPAGSQLDFEREVYVEPMQWVLRRLATRDSLDRLSEMPG